MDGRGPRGTGEETAEAEAERRGGVAGEGEGGAGEVGPKSSVVPRLGVDFLAISVVDFGTSN